MTTMKAAQTGLSLIDALIALAVAATTAFAAVAAQATLRQQAEATRQRAEALRLAQGRLERARHFQRLEAAGEAPGWDGLASTATQTADDLSAPTVYSVDPQVTTDAALPAKTLAVQVRWTGRDGQAQRLTGQTVIAGVAPQLSGSLALPRDALLLGRPAGRHVGVPLAAQDLGNGRSAWVPVAGQAEAWVFSNATGAITGVCSVAPTAPVLTAEALSGCADNTPALLISGHVRFGTETAQPADTALNLDMALDVPGARCVDDAPATADAARTRAVVRWACLVPAGAGAGGWSGRVTLQLQPFQGDNAAAPRTLCRYAATPAQYRAVTTSLMHQNHLVAPAAGPCPAGAQAA